MPDPPRQMASSLKGQMVAWPGGAGLCDPRVPARGGWSPSLTSAGLPVSFTTFTCVLVNPSLARPSMCCRLGPSLAAIARGGHVCVAMPGPQQPLRACVLAAQRRLRPGASWCRESAAVPVLSDKAELGRRRDSATHCQAAKRVMPGLRPGSAAWHPGVRRSPPTAQVWPRQRRWQSGDAGTSVSTPIHAGRRVAFHRASPCQLLPLSLSVPSEGGRQCLPRGAVMRCHRTVPTPCRLLSPLSLFRANYGAPSGVCLALWCPPPAVAVTRAASFLHEF